MKKVLWLCFVIISIIGCDQDAVIEKSVSVQFSLDGLPGSSGRLGELNEPSAVILSIKDIAGNTIANAQSMTLYSFPNGGFFTQELTLAPGKYQVTDFLVINSENQIIMLTPKEGSPKASLVDDPLPVIFDVSSSNHQTVIMQVTPVLADAAEYGYVKFGFEVVEQLLLKRLILRTDDGTGFDSWGKTEYQYNDKGQLLSSQYSYCYPDLDNCRQVCTSEYEYDEGGRLTRIFQTQDNGESRERNFIYEGNRIVKILDDQGYNWDKETMYYYENGSAIPSWSTVNDPVGSLVTKSFYEFNTQDQVLNIKTTKTTPDGSTLLYREVNYFFDQVGQDPLPFEFQLIGDEFPVDLNRNVTRFTYKYFNVDGSSKYECDSSFEVEYNTEGFPASIKFLDPGQCLHIVSDGVTHHYTYEYY